MANCFILLKLCSAIFDFAEYHWSEIENLQIEVYVVAETSAVLCRAHILTERLVAMKQLNILPATVFLVNV